MKLNHRSLRRVLTLALTLSLLLALAPTLSGGVLANGEPETPRVTVQNSDSVFFNANGEAVDDADDIADGGVMLSKTAAPVEGDPYSFDITLTVAATGISRPAPEANIVLVLDGSSSMNERDSNPICGKELHQHTRGGADQESCYDFGTANCGMVPHTHGEGCLTCTKEEHSHVFWCVFGCSKTPHTHSDENGCYMDTEHTHTDACYLTCTKEEHGRKQRGELVHLSTCYHSRAASAMQAAEDMISAFLKANISARLAVVGFGTTATCILSPIPLTEANRASFSDAIEEALTIGTNEGTNMQQGLILATEPCPANEQNFIIVISDGEPTLHGNPPDGNGNSMSDATKEATKKATTDAKAKGITLYGVAFTQNIDIMKDMFGSNYYTAADADALEETLVNSIAKSITTSISGVVSDTMSGYVDYVALAADTDADVAATVGYDAGKKVLNWNPGDLSVSQSITYRVTLNSTYDTKNSYDFVDANDHATLTFMGADQSEHEVSFPVPQVSAPLYHVTYQWAEGSATPDGATLPTDNSVYREGAEFTVSTEDYAALTDYTFSGWDILSGVDADGHVTGNITVEGSLTKQTTASSAPSNTSEPADTSKPSNTSESSDTSEPSDTSKPSDTSESSDTSKPSDTSEPSNTSKPSDTSEPSETTTTKATTTTVTTTEGASNEPPVATTTPAETTESATTTEPAETTEPSDVSAVTTAPSEPSDSSTVAPTETTPVAPVDPDVPDTSDTNHTTLFAAMAVLSAMGLLVLLLNARKSRKK